MTRQNWLLLSAAAIAVAWLAAPLRGEFVYAFSSNGVTGANGYVNGYSVNPSNGALTPVPGSPFPVGRWDNQTSLVADPSGRFLYAARLDVPGQPDLLGHILVFRIDSERGSLAAIPGSPFALNYGPGSIAIHPNGKFMYVTNTYCCASHTPVPGVFMYSIDSNTGSPTLVQQLGREGTFGVAVDPNGKFLYAERSYTGLLGYVIDPGAGTLTSIPEPWSNGGGTGSVAITPSGSFAYVANFSGNNVAGYRIDRDTGVLTTIPGSPFAAGQNPLTVVIDSVGSFAYVPNFGASLISAFKIDASTGSLTPIGSVQAAFVDSLAVDCTGKFVYGLGYGNNGHAVLGFKIDTQSGALTEMTTADIGGSGGSPTDIAVACAATGPASHVSALPAVEYTTNFAVQWFGTDNLSTISDYTVYASDTGGPFTAWLTNTTATQATFTGASGHTYGFYTIARDLAGNVEAPKYAPEVSTYIDAVKPVSKVSGLPATENFPSFTVQWSGTDVGGPGIATYSIYVSDNGGPFNAWLAQTSATRATFTGTNGHTYGFYSIAQDTYGVAENSKSAADAITLVQYPKPVSHVSALPSTASSPNFLVQWTGTDAGGPGIGKYNVYASDNGGAFTLWQTNTTAAQAWYVGRLGHSYGFFSQAIDTAGSQENMKSAAEATTQAPAHMVQDVNGDGQINCADLAVVKAALGTRPGLTGWNAAADINGDGVIDVRDVAAVSQKLVPGTTCN